MRRLSNEDGAVAVMIAILMIALIGMLALVVDASAVYGERRELQNGADAAALAIAEDCARGLSLCASRATTASTYANSNSKDLASDASITEFDPAGKVTVRTTTNDASGGILVKFAFAPIFDLVSDDDHTGRTVDASATATWGALGKLSGLPITVSDCEFDEATSDGTDYESMPISSSATPTVLVLHKGTGQPDASACPDSSAGMDVNSDGEKLPAGFGWLVNNNCVAVTTAYDGSDWVTKDSGVNPECQESELEKRLGSVVHLPIFGDYCRASGRTAPEPCASSSKDMYEILTYSGFYLTGFKLPSMTRSAPGWAPPACAGFCIAGFFVKDVVPNGPTGGSHPGGLVSISLIK